MPASEAQERLDAPYRPVAGKYLEFKRLDALCDHIAQHGITSVHFDTAVRCDPASRDDICTVAVYAVASQDLGTHVAVWGQVVGREWDAYLQDSATRESFHAKVRHHVEHFQALLEGKGLRVLPGIWSHQPPRYL